MGFINADTVLVGHGLENDLRALQLIHSTVLDTSAVFPHYCGLPFRYTAVQCTVQSSVRCSAVYGAVQCTVQCSVQ